VQRLLSRQCRAAACGQQTETLIEAARKLLERQHSQPRTANSIASGMPSSRWQIDQPSQHWRRSGQIRKRARALDEEPHGGVFARARRRQCAARVRRRQ